MISTILSSLFAVWTLGLWYFISRVALPRAAQYLADRHWVALPSWRGM
jgi:hypothetical protein